jgi:hypothetical protein
MNVNNVARESLFLSQTSPMSLTSPTTGRAGKQKAQETSTSDPFGIGSTGEIDEESFQNALVSHLLEERNSKAAEAYDLRFAQAQKAGHSAEDSVKIALSSVVDRRLIARETAEQINGISFRAAQLDHRLDALYDGRGGPGDDTVAKSSVQDATSKALEVLNRMKSGELSVESRSLNALSNVAPRTHLAHGGSGGFLWKPNSESDGRLVVLLPSQYTGRVMSAGIYESMPPTEEGLIEEGKFSGDSHNGGRAHFRFNRAGGAYPNNVYVVARTTDGRTVSFPIANGSQRVSR